MKRVLLVFSIVFLIFSIAAFINMLSNKYTPKNLADKVMAKVVSGDLDSAFKIMKPYSFLTSDEINNIALQSKNVREQYKHKYGVSKNYELVSIKKIKNSILRLRYIEHTENNALFWNFYFYKSKKGWILNAFYWNDEIGQFFFE